VRTMADLEEVATDMRVRYGRKIRVATKYVNLTRRFFAERGVSDYRIVESLGATEGAPGSGSAELIVDITTTGATLAANALRVLDDGVILRSEANLVAALRAPWSDRARRTAQTVLTRIAAEEIARTTREVRASFEWIEMERVEQAVAPLGASLKLGVEAGGEVILQCPVSRRFDVVAALQDLGARNVTVRAVEYVFEPSNALTDGLLQRLS
jgi:ATP phosphoribosyltransferase